MGAQWKAKGKAAAADARGKLFGRLAKDIMVAARNGADPASNSRLRLVVEQARKVSMPKETLERAIKKGAGLTGETVHFEHVMYEGFAPHQVPLMVECLTDNVKRTAPEMRVLFRKGQLGASGSVAWDFSRSCSVAESTPRHSTSARAYSEPLPIPSACSKKWSRDDRSGGANANRTPCGFASWRTSSSRQADTLSPS